jgi:ubiquinone/menaquinone biosynthesis C-methylase UbiE
MRAALIALLALCASTAHAEPLGQRYEQHAAHDGDGIGKFYLGREIAQVMGPGGILWLERTERETQEQPQRVIDALEIKSGQTIADLGAGSGYYSFRIASLVGPAGKVLAIDIEPAMLAAIAQRARREHIGNVATVRSSTQDPNLAPGSVDLLFMVDVYHELEYPYEMLTKVRTALKPRGRVALIEYRAEDPDVLIKPLHKMAERQVRREMQAAGFKHVKTVRTLPLQHVILFEADR